MDYIKCRKRCLYLPVNNLSMRIISGMSLHSLRMKQTSSPTNSPISHFYPRRKMELSISWLVRDSRNKICMIRGTSFCNSLPMPANIWFRMSKVSPCFSDRDLSLRIWKSDLRIII
jgi:hypothetical protein